MINARKLRWKTARNKVIFRTIRIDEQMEILRFTTAGGVDDGKSTLKGRLLYASKSIFEDQMAAVKASSERKGLANIDLSLLTDGLKAEREQGITIDVAYRYFRSEAQTAELQSLMLISYDVIYLTKKKT